MDDATSSHVSRVAKELELPTDHVGNVVRLLDEDNTVPFITRYRKEWTGNLDEEQIRQIQQRVNLLRQLSDRAKTILRLIETQGKLTPSLRSSIEKAETVKRLEDLYLPFRPKRKSRAVLARSRGLEPLADQIWSGDASLTDLDAAAEALIDPEKELSEVSAVLQGAADILAERISENADVRAKARKIAWQTGTLCVSPTKLAEKEGQEYRDYFDYTEAISKIPPHRALALNRGEKVGVLRVKFEFDVAQTQTVVSIFLRLMNQRHREFMAACLSDALQRLIYPSLDREIRREVSERAEQHAVSVFARNLRSLLIQPPLRDERILAIDPGFRTGCKIAVLDATGSCQATDVIYVTGSGEKRKANANKLVALIREHSCTVIAIGNGTACRETEELISEIISEQMPELRYVIVNEAGASIYSASTVAREEFPDFDATVRGTISIGRRLQDPLSELVKIEPQHIGVGMYQHDVPPKLLKESLEDVIESCVNYVGVDLNTASASLLRHVSGMNQLTARRLVEWRQQHGRFSDRRQLLEVPGVGEAKFTQAAGFLKISGGDEPLDATWIHPESYDAARKLLEKLSMPPDNLVKTNGALNEFRDQLSELDPNALTQELAVGLPTVRDIIEALGKPGRDPRTDLPGPVFRQGVLKLEDLHEGLELRGTVLNVVDFGAFVDIGLKDSGLIHVSKLANRFVKSPHEIVSVGDVVTIWVLSVDLERRRAGLTMVKPESVISADSDRKEADTSEVAESEVDGPVIGHPS